MDEEIKLPATAMRTEISESVYQVLSRAGTICADYCQIDPDMLDAIADGIVRFIADGDVFEQVIATIISMEPDLVKRCLDRQTDEVMKQLGEAFTDA